MDRPWFKHYDEGISHTLDLPDKHLAQYLSDAAAKYPNRPALVFGARVGKKCMDKALTYGELDRLVDRFASGLQQMGVKKGDRVAVMLPNCPQYVITAYAAWRIGAVLVCCNPLYMPPEIKHLLNDSGAETMVVLSAMYDKVEQVRSETGLKTVIVTNIKEYFPGFLKFLFTWTKEKKEGHRVNITSNTDACRFNDVLHGGPSKPDPVTVAPTDPSTLIYTGGTTGVPKGAQHTHQSQAYNALCLKTWSKTEDHGEVMLAVMPMFHIYGLAVVLNTTIAAAMTAVLIPNPRDLEHVLLAIEKHKATFYPGVPAMFTAFNNYPGVENRNVSTLRFAASAAAPLAPEVQQKFEELTKGKLVEAYGLTETIAACMDPIGNPRHHSIGVPLPGMTLAIVDPGDDTKEMPVGEVGEIVVKGPTVMTGYRGKPEQTAEAIRVGPDGENGWFHTGDMGYMEEDGYFHIVDRRKDLIIAGGYNIYPAEVEAVLFDHPAVLEAAVIGVLDEKRGETVKAFIVLKEGHEGDKEAIIEFCRERMAAFKAPRFIEFRDDLPKSLVGKVLRRELREEEEANAGNL